MHKEEHLLNTAEVCEILGIKPYTVSRWVAKGTIAPIARGSGRRGHMLFLRAEVDRVAAERTAAA
jgi:excisionase family DNA binding protein